MKAKKQIKRLKRRVLILEKIMESTAAPEVVRDVLESVS